MTRKRILLLAASLLAMSAFILTGCDDDDDATVETSDDTGSIVAPPSSDATAFVYGCANGEGFDGEFHYDRSATVVVTNDASIPTVSINGSGLRSEVMFGGGDAGHRFNGSFKAVESGTATLTVDFGEDDGTATATVGLPGDITLIGGFEQSLAEDGTGTATWTAADDAERYLVTASCWAAWTETDGEPHEERSALNLAVSDTFLSVDPAMFQIDPATVQQLDNLTVWVEVMPVSGPATAGDVPNVTGACDGYFVGMTQMPVCTALRLHPLEKSDRTDAPRPEVDWLQVYIDTMR